MSYIMNLYMKNVILLQNTEIMMIIL